MSTIGDNFRATDTTTFIITYKDATAAVTFFGPARGPTKTLQYRYYYYYYYNSLSESLV